MALGYCQHPLCLLPPVTPARLALHALSGIVGEGVPATAWRHRGPVACWTYTF